METVSERIKTIYLGVHSCTLCHGNPNGTIKPDSEKIPRKFFSRIVDSKLFMVAQSLAETQVRVSGVPFHDIHGNISNGGRFLEKFLNVVGYTISPDKLEFSLIYSTDIVQCYPGKNLVGTGDNLPLSSEIELCRPWLDQALSLLEPQVILLFGSPANKTFFKHYLHQEFTKLSDYYLRSSCYKDIRVFSLPHPTSMVRDKTAIYQETFELIQSAMQ